MSVALVRRRVGAEKVRVEADRCNPARNEPSILPGRDGAAVITTATEQKFAGFFARGFDVIVDRLPRLFRQLKPDGPTRLPLPHCCAIDRISADATSSTRIETTSQPRRLLSIARLNIAKSRVRPSICNRARIDQTCFGRNGGFWPMRRVVAKTGISPDAFDPKPTSQPAENGVLCRDSEVRVREVGHRVKQGNAAGTGPAGRARCRAPHLE